jgi:putative endonuclease
MYIQSVAWCFASAVLLGLRPPSSRGKSLGWAQSKAYVFNLLNYIVFYPSTHLLMYLSAESNPFVSIQTVAVDSGGAVLRCGMSRGILTPIWAHSCEERSRRPMSEGEKGKETGRWSVYLLECADGTLYCGVSTDLNKRLAEHNGESPGGARYTRGRRPARLLASRACATRSEACKLEARVKRAKKGEKLGFFGDGDSAATA